MNEKLMKETVLKLINAWDTIDNAEACVDEITRIVIDFEFQTRRDQQEKTSNTMLMGFGEAFDGKA